MKFFDFWAFQNFKQMLSHDKIIFHMLFGAFHITLRKPSHQQVNFPDVKKSYASSTCKWTGGNNLKILYPKFNDDFWYDFNKEKVDTDVSHKGDFGQSSKALIPRLRICLSDQFQVLIKLTNFRSNLENTVIKPSYKLSYNDPFLPEWTMLRGIFRKNR